MTTKNIKLAISDQSSQMNQGFITLLSVLIVGTVGLAISIALIQLGIGSSRSSFALRQSYQARVLANTCAEEALQQIRDNIAYTGTINLTLGQDTCSSTVINDGGENRTVTSTGTVGTIVRKVKVTITAIDPIITTSPWIEVADF